ncbi:hypothetical protein Tco_1316185 [Tanacetum coccineum]
MADNRTMAQLLEAPTEGYEDAIVVPEITANNFEIKHGLLNLVQNKQFFGHDKEDPHAHIRYFNKITSTMKFSNVPNRFNDLLRGCPHHGFSELHQLDTFYNALNSNDQDSLNSAAGVVAKVSTSSSIPAVSPDVAELQDMVRALILDKKNQTPAPVKAEVHWDLESHWEETSDVTEKHWMLPKLFILWLATVSTDSAALVPIGKVSTAIETLKKIPPRAIFDAIQLMGYEGDLTVLAFNKALFSPQWRHLDAKKKFVMYPRFISIFLDKQLVNVPVPLDHFPVNALTSKVFSFMVKKGKHFSGKVTPLFASMLVQSTEDEGATLERPSEPQPTPSPPHPSEANIKPQSDPSPRPSPTPHIPDSIPEVSGGNHGGQSSSDKSLSGNEGDMTLQSVYALCISLCTHVTDQANEIKHLKAQIKKLKKQAKPVITHHRAWMKSGRKSAKAEPSVHKDPLFDELDDDKIDNMDTEDAQDVGRTRNGVNAEKEGTEDAVSTLLSTAQQIVDEEILELKGLLIMCLPLADERLIKEMNEKELILSKNMNVSKEEIVTFESIFDSEIMEKKSVIARLNKGAVLRSYIRWICIDSLGRLEDYDGILTEEFEQSLLLDVWVQQGEFSLGRLYESCGSCIWYLRDG